MKSRVYFGNETQTLKLRLLPGKYRFECWGGKGSSMAGVFNCGGYVSGDFYLTFIETFFVYIGGIGEDGVGGFNGGGISQKGGGGATDVRLRYGVDWNDFESLKSRIIVAGGAGGTDGKTSEEADRGGCGGGLNGGNSTNNKGKGGTQTNGGNGKDSGAFGNGGSNDRLGSGGNPNDGNGAGGGGYYGGGTSTEMYWDGGGGGSSFISGHTDCNAIDKDYSLDNPKHTNQTKHYSNFYFINTKMVDGCSSDMSLPNSTGIGQYCGVGAFRLTILRQSLTSNVSYFERTVIALCFAIIISS